NDQSRDRSRNRHTNLLRQRVGRTEFLVSILAPKGNCEPAFCPTLTRRAEAALFHERNAIQGARNPLKMLRALGSYGRSFNGVEVPTSNLAPETGAWIIGDGEKPPV